MNDRQRTAQTETALHDPLRVSAPDRPVVELMSSSNQTALQQLARDLIDRPPGSRMATTVQYQNELQVGSGTIQKALGILESSRAVSLRKRGHQGTFVTERDFGLLWNIAHFGEVRVVLAPPGPIDGFGLASGIGAELDRLVVPSRLLYASGATRRIDMVLEGAADVAVVSEGAAEHLDAKLRQQLQFFPIGPDTYYRPDSLIVLGRADRPIDISSGRCVAIDHGSHDHVMLTRAEFPLSDGFEHVACDYVQVPTAILRGIVDFGVWHRMQLLVPLDLIGISTSSLSRAETLHVRDRLAGAVMVVRAGRREFHSLLAEIDRSAIVDAQSRLLSLPPDSEEFRLSVWST